MVEAAAAAEEAAEEEETGTRWKERRSLEPMEKSERLPKEVEGTGMGRGSSGGGGGGAGPRRSVDGGRRMGGQAESCSMVGRAAVEEEKDIKGGKGKEWTKGMGMGRGNGKRESEGERGKEGEGRGPRQV